MSSAAIRICTLIALLVATAVAVQAQTPAGESREFDGMEFVWLPAGEFQMGSTGMYAYEDEQPLTRVRISRGYWLGKYEVTQAEWEAVMGSNPSKFDECGPNCPVEQVSWEDVQEFIRELNAAVGEERYRLPTEAEWEYAARAGTSEDTHSGNLTDLYGRDPVLEGIAWYRRNSGGRTQPVGRKAPNPWGLYDMLGNVQEWVQDWYGDHLQGGTVTDPRGPESGSVRMLRGGSWHFHSKCCRVSHRYIGPSGTRSGDLGFRLLRTE